MIILDIFSFILLVTIFKINLYKFSLKTDMIFFLQLSKDIINIIFKIYKYK